MTSKPSITSAQWRSGTAAWLGWLFDGLELHLYTLVAAPLVVHLLSASSASDPAVIQKSAWIQAAFLVGWAVGGACFGRLGDVLGRSRTLSLTVLTYAVCTGLCAFAQTWWQLMIFRFVAALGIGGEWAVGAALLVETWPRSWRPWLAAWLQTGVNLGILTAAAIVGSLALLRHPPPERFVFLVGIIPAFLVFWIRRKVPEPEAWQQADHSTARGSGIALLFRNGLGRRTSHASIVCAFGLSVWWLFLFWHPQHLRQILTSEGVSSGQVTQRVAAVFFAVILVSIPGNFFAGWLARRMGNPRAMALLFAGLGVAMVGAFIVPRGFTALGWFWLPLTGFFSGVFGLFTMYLPPLFPTALRTTGAGFCFNIGRLAAAAASILFGWLAPVGDLRMALLVSSSLALFAAVGSWWLPVETD